MKGYVLAIVIILFCSFCVFCYHTRTNYNVDNLEEQVAYLKYEKAVLFYALSIVPKEVKSEVFFNSVKEKFPSIEENQSITDLIKMEKKKEDEVSESTVEEEKKIQTVTEAMAEIINDMTNSK